jgi:hypothetical protein
MEQEDRERRRRRGATLRKRVCALVPRFPYASQRRADRDCCGVAHGRQELPELRKRRARRNRTSSEACRTARKRPRKLVDAAAAVAGVSALLLALVCAAATAVLAGAGARPCGDGVAVAAAARSGNANRNERPRAAQTRRDTGLVEDVAAVLRVAAADLTSVVAGHAGKKASDLAWSLCSKVLLGWMPLPGDLLRIFE